ncbi:hypothetical protein [Pseudocitrobacter sp. RIT415]|nr:hypothetical protein [Pseudocitrobacter sp. RIT 415]
MNGCSGNGKEVEEVALLGYFALDPPEWVEITSLSSAVGLNIFE